jgi:hypothetical protein
MLPRLAELWKGRKVMYFVATNHIEYFDRAVTRSERFDALIFMSPPSFAVKRGKVLRVLKDAYHVEATFAPDITKEAVDGAMPIARCKEFAESDDKHRRVIGAERLQEENVLAKFALLRWDELDELAAYLAEGLSTERAISKQALEKALTRIKDGKSRSLREYCRFRSDPDDYERFDTSRTARWLVSEIVDSTFTSAELPTPVAELDGVRAIDAPVGPAERLRVPGFVVERSGHGQVRLRRAPPS